MKKIFGALLALVSSAAFAATLVPVQLLNPAGSTAGQAAVSTGPTTAPAWTSVNAVTLNGFTFANPGPIGGTTPSTGVFTNVQVNEPASSAATIFINAPSDTNGANLKLTGNGATTPSKYIRVNGGVLQVMNSAYSSILFQVQDNGDISAPAMDSTPIGATTPSTGAFTTLSATGTVTIPAGQTLPTPNITGITSGTAVAAGNVGETKTSGVQTGVAVAANAATNIASVALTPGYWMIYANVQFISGSNTIGTGGYQASISTTSATQNTAVTNWTGFNGVALAAGAAPTSTPPVLFQNISSSTTYYLVGTANFSAASTANGVISAVRLH